MNLGVPLEDLGQHGDAVAAYKEALENWRTAAAQDPLQWNEELAHTLYNYGTVLVASGQVSEAAKVEKEAVSLYRGVAQTGIQYPQWLCAALHSYGRSCQLLGQHEEAVLAFEECIPIWYTLLIKDYKYTQSLANSFHDMAISLHMLERHKDADAAASKCIQLSRDKAHKGCQYEPNLDQCYVCQRVADNTYIVTAGPGAATVDDPIVNHLPNSFPLDDPTQSYSSLPTPDITPVVPQSYVASAKELPPIPHRQFEPTILPSSIEVQIQSSLQSAQANSQQEIPPESSLGTAGTERSKKVLGSLGKKFT